MRDEGGRRAVLGGLRFVLAAAAAWLLFGDWSAPGLSNLATGQSGNWLLLTAGVQVVALVAALLLGRLRGALLTLPLLCWAGIGLLLTVHLFDAAFADRALGEYAVQKVQAWFFLCGPALLLGIALGREAHGPAGSAANVSTARLAAGKWFLACTLPLVALCAIALANDPRYLTVASYWHPFVLFGWLVLPVHQALACCLAKQGLFAAAFVASRCRSGIRRAACLSLLGVLCGLVLLTGARGYVAGLAASVAVTMLFGRRRVGPVLVTAMIGAVLFQTLAPNVVQERLDPRLTVQSKSYNERETAWRCALQAFADSPVVGQGPGGFATFMGWNGRAYAHNLVLEFASELGTAGVVLLVILLLAAGAPVVRAWRRRMPLNAVQAFAVGFLVFSVIGAMLIGDWIRNGFLFLAIGMAHGALRAPRRAPAWAPGPMLSRGGFPAPVRLRGAAGAAASPSPLQAPSSS